YATIRVFTPRPRPVDEEPPTVRITAPADDQVLYSAEVTIAWEAVDDAGVERTEIRVDGGSFADAGPGGSYELSLEEGAHEVTVRATDGAGHTGSDEVRFEIRLGEAPPPSVRIVAPVEGARVEQSPVVVRWESEGRLEREQLRVDGGEWLTVAEGEAELLLAEGFHAVEMRVEDEQQRTATDDVLFEASLPACTPTGMQSKGVWAWGSTLREAGTTAVVAEMTAHGITDLMVMVRGADGSFRTDTLDEVIALARSSSPTLRVHAWLACFHDDSGWIHPGDATYRAHLLDEVIRPILAGHDVDGLSLDYIRFPGTAEGDTASVSSFVQQVRASVDELRPGTLLSVAVMPEGDATATYYGQDYAELAGPADVLLPMTYTYNYEQGAAWVQTMTAHLVEKAAGKAAVWPVLQSYNDEGDHMPAGRLAEEIDAALAGGAAGVNLFRYPVVAGQYASLDDYPVEICQQTGDQTPPSVHISSPEDGDRIEGPARIAWSAEDDVGVARAAAWLDRGAWLEPVPAELDLDAGAHALVVMAWDAAGNAGMDRVEFEVVEEASDGGHPDGGSDAGQDEEPSGGCACSSSGRALDWLWGLLLVSLCFRTSRPRRVMRRSIGGWHVWSMSRMARPSCAVRRRP
ncbi:MAG: hypothetical protein JXR96_26015, partial [Deltaproteobacteria bacterium]|nr:hypothetical protein [Deltaproteobacteria bacterium]